MTRQSQPSSESNDVIATKLDYLSGDIQEIKGIIKEIASKQDMQDKRITVVEGKTGMFAGILAVFTVVASSIAAWFGARN